MNIPKHLRRCPIVDSICEIRFESSFPSEIVTGMIVGALGSITEIEGLPVLQIPEAIRNIDEQLKFAPHYKAKIGEITLQFGGGVIAISSPIPYIGWIAFKPKIEEVLDKLISNKLIKNITRVARRTVNFFPDDILEHSTFKVHTPIEQEKKQYHYTDHYCDGDNMMIRTTIANKAVYQISEGSVIDIDAFIELNNEPQLENIMEAIEKTHQESKKVFFTLLTPDFIKSMEPEYV